jgi:microcystin-dependent protein
MRVVLFFLFIFLGLQGNAQTGIGTTTPNASAKLDVTATDKGFLTPRMTAAQRGTIPSPAAGLLVYQIDGTIGFYYYNGVAWIIIAAEPFGDVKSNFRNTDHNGWIRLDGRLKTTLSNTQQTQATALGIGANLPDATDSYLVQRSGASGAISGSNTSTLSVDNLPSHNHTFNGINASTGNDTHSHTYNDAYFAEGRNEAERVGNNQRYGLGAGSDNDNSFIWRTANNENSVSIQNINTSQYQHGHNYTPSGTIANTGTGVAFSNAPRSLTVNMFIYLGL